MLSLEIMPPLMFGGLVVFLLIGFPVAFSLAATGLFFGFLSIELGFFTNAYLGNLPLRVFGILSNDLLLAIPFFTLMGAILERCGWPRTCWRAPASSSARCRAASPTR
jgi:TRAP-type mannitol/chloroaromatic compound transport system permease large subunit